MCWIQFRCQSSILNSLDPICLQHCPAARCRELVSRTCPDSIMIPNQPIAFGHVYLIIKKQTLITSFLWRPPAYVCYNDQLCTSFYPNRTLLASNNHTCREPQDFPLGHTTFGKTLWLDVYVKPLYADASRCNTIIQQNLSFCDSPVMYRCLKSSKCISIYRLCDGVVDCDYQDDEQCSSVNGSCLAQRPQVLFKCTTTAICISQRRINDARCDCGFDRYGLCDGIAVLRPLVIEGRNESDETECEHWSCDNSYTRCNGVWNCRNGADEVDCDSAPLVTCPSRHHHCVSSTSYRLMCLPVEKASDGRIDCVGATDEPLLCRSNDYQPSEEGFRCNVNGQPICITPLQLCDGYMDCENGDDERFCARNRTMPHFGSICRSEYQDMRSDEERYICAHRVYPAKQKIIYFSIGQHENATHIRKARPEMPSWSSSASVARHRPSHHTRSLPLSS